MDENLLNAYIDGELSDKEAREVKERLLADPQARRYVESAKKIDSIARLALDEAVAREFRATPIEKRLESIEPQPARRSLSRQPYLAMAASIMILAIGYGAGMITTDNRIQQKMAAMEEARSDALKEVRAALDNVLEYTPSGKTVVWESNRHQATAELIPVRTLQTQDKKFCREFREILIVEGQREERRGVSCRLGKENWQTRMLLQDSERAVF